MASKCVLLPGNNTLIKYQLPWLTFVASRIITVVNVLSEFSTLMWLFQVIIGPLSVVSMCVCVVHVLCTCIVPCHMAVCGWVGWWRRQWFMQVMNSFQSIIVCDYSSQYQIHACFSIK